MEREYKMSAARAQELQEELNYLKTTRSDEVAEQIKVAWGSNGIRTYLANLSGAKVLA